MRDHELTMVTEKVVAKVELYMSSMRHSCAATTPTFDVKLMQD